MHGLEFINGMEVYTVIAQAHGAAHWTTWQR